MFKNNKNKKTWWEKKIFVIIPTFLCDLSLFWGDFYSHYSKCWQQARCCCREVLIMSLCCQWKDSSCGTVQNMFPLFNSYCWLLIFGSFVSVVVSLRPPKQHIFLPCFHLQVHGMTKRKSGRPLWKSLFRGDILFFSLVSFFNLTEQKSTWTKRRTQTESYAP